MNTSKITLLSILLWSIAVLTANASSPHGNLEIITSANGLNNNTIYNIVYDQKGYVWFATDMGISRYDGFHFRNFPHIIKGNSQETAALPQAVRKISIDKNQLLYLQLLNGEMVCFDTAKERYLPVNFGPSTTIKKINGIYIAESHILYIATNEGLYSAEVLQANNEVQLKLPETPLVKGNISLLRSDDKGNLFFCVNSTSVVHYIMGTRQTQVIDANGNSKTKISALCVKNNLLWICRKFENIAIYDYNRKNIRTLTYTNEEGKHLNNTFITSIAQIDEKTFYAATWEGLYSIKFENERTYSSPCTIEHITQQERTNLFSVEGKMTSLLWDDSQKILWIGTFGGGIATLSFNEGVYQRTGQRLGTEIRGIKEDALGYIWIATERKGLWKSVERTLTAATTFQPWTQGTGASEDYRMCKDRNGNIWLGDEKGNLTCINPLTATSQVYQINPIGTKDFSGGVVQLYMDTRQRLWVVTSQGLVLFNAQNGESSLAVKLEGGIKAITAVAEDAEGEIWIGTDIGVKRLSLEGSKTSLLGNYEEQAGIAASTVSSIYVNSNNQIFVSYTGKMIRIDGREKSKIETLFTLNNGLNSGHTFCMIDDNNGNTWVGSNSGIMTIRNDRTSFYNYSLAGYCNNVCRLRDGRLLWSDSWGLLFFDPMIVKNRRSQKQLTLTDLWVNGKSVAVGTEINGQVILQTGPDSQESFTFSAANNDFSFYFSDMQYDLMQRKIAYKMLPEEDWILCSLEKGIHYNNLKRGKYTLQVKLIYPDASEGEILEVPIVVKQYWWKTIWAILCYILLAGSTLLVLHRHVRGKKCCQETQPIKAKPKETKNPQNIVATRFIEELRTPLSMIIAPLREVLQEKELSKGLSTKMLIAYRNSMGMLNACEQLLNVFSYVPKERVEVAPYPIVKLIDAFVFSMNEFLRVHPIDFKYEKKIKKNLEVWVDKKALNFILQNMISNALIHLRYSGAIALILQETIEGEERYCTISVVDNGKATVRAIEDIESNEELEQLDSTEIELGYAIMQKIMKQHHGDTSLESLNGNGTKMQIKLPINKTVLEQDTNIVFINPEEEEIMLPQQGTSIKTNLQEEEIEETTIPATPVSNINQIRKKILIIEDYKDIRFYLKTLFEREYDILLAENGAEGVDIARKELPDLIISDIMMPVKDGYDCCRELKEGLDTCHIPFILLTAKVEDEDVIKGLEIGADDYILKPFTPKILKIKVKNLIEGRMNLKNMYTQLLVDLPEENEQPESKAKAEIEDPFISTVVKIIEENIKEPDFNVKKLASDLNMSQPTLYRKVKQSTDFTIIELIRGVRMKKAATLLKKKQHAVQEVAEMVGYNDIPTFRKHFVDTYGTTPSTFADSNASEKE